MNQTAFGVITIIGVSLIFTFFALLLVSWIVILIIHFRETYKEHELKKNKIKTLSLYQGKDEISDYPYTYSTYRRLRRLIKRAKYKDLTLRLYVVTTYYSKGAKNREK